jgi:glycine/D-amino acid oxidase-like deaminating enzyme
MENKKVNIVGWGIAGANIAWHLKERSVEFEVYDSGRNHATRIAAGMINPIGFRRQIKSWQADLLVPYALNFYQQKVDELNANIFRQADIFRVFTDIEEANNWSAREGDDRYTEYMDTPNQNELPDLLEVDFPFGIGRVNGMHHLDTAEFLDLSKSYLEKKGVKFHNHNFDYGDIAPTQMYIFCEGTGMWNNPIFKDLPLNGTHGETIDIVTEKFDFKHVLNKRLYIKPMGHQTYRIGATYNWELKEPIKSPEGIDELKERLEAFTHFKYEIAAHQAGIRPTVKDRRPIIGRDEKYKNAFLFNGLGTKGVMVAPYYANQLCQFIFDNGTLDAEVNLNRFRKD